MTAADNMPFVHIDAWLKNNSVDLPYWIVNHSFHQNYLEWRSENVTLHKWITTSIVQIFVNRNSALKITNTTTTHQMIRSKLFKSSIIQWVGSLITKFFNSLQRSVFFFSELSNIRNIHRDDRTFVYLVTNSTLMTFNSSIIITVLHNKILWYYLRHQYYILHWLTLHFN